MTHINKQINQRKLNNFNNFHNEAETKFLRDILHKNFSIDEIEKKVWDTWDRSTKKKKKLSTEPATQVLISNELDEDYTASTAKAFGCILKNSLYSSKRRKREKGGYEVPVSYDYLAKLMRKSRRTAIRAINYLVNNDVIGKELKKTNGKKQNWLFIKSGNYLTPLQIVKLNLQNQLEKREEIVAEEIKKIDKEKECLQALLQDNSSDKMSLNIARTNNNHIENLNEEEEEKVENLQLITEPAEKIETFSEEELRKICQNWSKNQFIVFVTNQSRAIQYLYDCNGRQIKANDKLSIVNDEIMNENSQLRWKCKSLAKLKYKNGDAEEGAFQKREVKETQITLQEKLEVAKCKLKLIDKRMKTCTELGLSFDDVEKLRNWVEARERRVV